MKRLTTSALALCMLIFVGCADSTTPAPNADIANATNKVEASVEGMDCVSCSGAIVSAVEDIEGVTGCHADAKTGAVQVALTNDADAEATKAEVEKVIAGLKDGKFTVSTIAVSTGSEKVCAEGCEKSCCSEGGHEGETMSCPEGCEKECCKEGEAKAGTVIDDMKDEMKDMKEDMEKEAGKVMDDLDIPALGSE